MSSSGSSTPSPKQVFTTYGLRRALQATVHFGPNLDPAASETKDDRYRRYIEERHSHLLQEITVANAAFDAISEAWHEYDGDAAPVEMARLHREYLDANNRVLRAERMFSEFEAELEELEAMEVDWSREDAQLFSDQKTLERWRREEAAAEERVRAGYEERIRVTGEERCRLEVEKRVLREDYKKAIIFAQKVLDENIELREAQRQLEEKFATMRAETNVKFSALQQEVRMSHASGGAESGTMTPFTDYASGDGSSTAISSPPLDWPLRTVSWTEQWNFPRKARWLLGWGL